MDLSNNPICNEENYREKILEALKKNTSDEEDRIVLDCKDEDGISVSDNSDDEEEGEGDFDLMGGEGGEDDIYDDLDISSELIEKMKNGTVTEEEMQEINRKMGVVDYGDEEGEEENDSDDDEPESKKQKTE